MPRVHLIGCWGVKFHKTIKVLDRPTDRQYMGTNRQTDTSILWTCPAEGPGQLKNAKSGTHDRRTSRLRDWIGPVGQFSEKFQIGWRKLVFWQSVHVDRVWPVGGCWLGLGSALQTTPSATIPPYCPTATLPTYCPSATLPPYCTSATLLYCPTVKHYSHTTVTLQSHYSHTTVTLQSHYSHTAVTLQSHYSDTTLQCSATAGQGWQSH